MASKESFTQEEWTKVAEAPMLAGLGVSMLDFGLVSFTKEFSAMIKAVAAARAEYPNNQLVQSLVAELESKEQNPPAEQGEKKTTDQILADLGTVAAIVDTRASSADEAREFKSFVFGVGEKVANASGSGFLGFGAKVSDAERDYLARLRAQLGI